MKVYIYTQDFVFTVEGSTARDFFLEELLRQSIKRMLVSYTYGGSIYLYNSDVFFFS